MKLAQLKKIPVGDPGAGARSSPAIRGTGAQDTPLATPVPLWRRYRVASAVAAAALVLLTLGLAFKGWLSTGQVVARERLRLATVTRGEFVRDVAADGTVVAAVSPTLFAIAPGTVDYAVHAGDAVHKGQLLATLESPELTNELQREQATLDSLDAALARQQIEIRRQILGGQQHADLAQVAIDAAERELKRSQWAWDQRVISERDYTRAIDDWPSFPPCKRYAHFALLWSAGASAEVQRRVRAGCPHRVRASAGRTHCLTARRTQCSGNLQWTQALGMHSSRDRRGWHSRCRETIV